MGKREKMEWKTLLNKLYSFRVLRTCLGQVLLIIRGILFTNIRKNEYAICGKNAHGVFNSCQQVDEIDILGNRTSS